VDNGNMEQIEKTLGGCLY